MKMTIPLKSNFFTSQDKLSHSYFRKDQTIILWYIASNLLLPCNGARWVKHPSACQMPTCFVEKRTTQTHDYWQFNQYAPPDPSAHSTSSKDQRMLHILSRLNQEITKNKGISDSSTVPEDIPENRSWVLANGFRMSYWLLQYAQEET